MERPATLPYAKQDAIGRSVDYSAGRNRYVGYLISLSRFSFKGMKVGSGLLQRLHLPNGQEYF